MSEGAQGYTVVSEPRFQVAKVACGCVYLEEKQASTQKGGAPEDPWGCCLAWGSTGHQVQADGTSACQ